METSLSSRSITGRGGVWAVLCSRVKCTSVAVCVLVCFAYAIVVLIPDDRGTFVDSSGDFADWWSRTFRRPAGAVELESKRRPWRQDRGVRGQESGSSEYMAGIRHSAGSNGASAAGPAIRMKLVHRNSPESPLRKEYTTLGKALEDARKMDIVRLAGFRKRILAEAYDWRNVAAAASSGNTVTKAGDAEPPATLATIENPNGGLPAAENSFQTSLVSGSTLGSGQYLVSFSIGTPAQNFFLVADTGSDLIWVQCSPCTQCYTQNDPLYSPFNSSTFVPVPCFSNECNLIPATPGFPCDVAYPGACAYVYQYADASSTKGVFAFETATLKSSGSSSSAVNIGNVAFGCGTDNQGSFQGADGVLGLGQGPLSFTSQIGYAYGDVFSYCLVSYLEPVSVTSSLVFGDDGVLFANDTLQYTPILNNPRSGTLYYVGIEEVSVAGSSLDIPSTAWSFDLMGDGGTTIDSGSTLTYFVPAAYSVILNAFKQALLQQYPQVIETQQQTFDLCFNISGVDSPQYPDFRIRFQNNADLSPPPENYLVDVAPDVKCLAFQGLQSDFGFNTIGNLLQQNFLVVYDRHSSRIGFARSHCAGTD